MKTLDECHRCSRQHCLPSECPRDVAAAARQAGASLRLLSLQETNQALDEVQGENIHVVLDHIQRALLAANRISLPTGTTG